MPEFTGHKDLRSYLRIIWRWKVLVLAFVIGAPAVAYLLEHGKPAVYRSTALVGVNETTVTTTLLGGATSSGFSTSNVTAIAALVTTTPVANIAAGLMHPPVPAGSIVGEVTASGDPMTNFLTISAEDHSARRAAEIANAFAQAISINRQRDAENQLNSGIKGIQTQLNSLGPRNPQRSALEEQLTQLKAAVNTQGSQATVLQPASPNFAAVGPHLRRTMELALVIGILLAFGAIAVAENADRRLRTPSDLEGMTELPLLAAIAPTAFSGQLETTQEDEEAFNTLRTALTYLNVDRHLESLMVTSPGEKDGKTTVATRLALAMARAGQRVILVDGDLRRAQVSAKLGITTPAGLGTVLSREHSLVETLVEYPVLAPGSGRLKVLPAGAPPPNPSALIGSDEMRRVLRVLEAQSDVVIIDTPAALAVSDPLPLMRSVTGVVMVARMNRSSKETIRRLHRMIVSAHGTMLGVVATGVKSGPGYEPYAAKYYGPEHKRGVRSRLSRSRPRAESPAESASEPAKGKPADSEASAASAASRKSGARAAGKTTVAPAGKTAVAPAAPAAGKNGAHAAEGNGSSTEKVEAVKSAVKSKPAPAAD